MARIISAEQVSHYLQAAREVAVSGGVVDAHVHGTEVIYGANRQKLARAPSSGMRAPARPARAGSISEVEPEDLCCADPDLLKRYSELSFTALYHHVGPATLQEHMALAHVTRALLLAVAPPTGDVEDQLHFLSRLRSEVSGISIAYSLPHHVSIDRIGQTLGEAVRTHQVCAVKLHTNLSRIDPRSPAGRERIHALLQACDDHRLPIIVHGGASPILGADESAHYGVLDTLETIDWSCTRATVVIAHCGLYGRGGPDRVERDLPILRKMLSRWPHMTVDTSGVPSDVLAQVLRSVDADRILFGSDALYVPMWRAVAICMHAIALSGGLLDRDFARIAQLNPAAWLNLV